MRIVAALCLSIALVASATAAPPSPESIDTLLALTKSERLVDGMFANIDQVMQQAMRAAMQGEPMTAEQQRVMNTMREKFVAIFREEMNWAKLRPMYVRIYQDSFTQDEVDGLVAFYRTPTGQALVDKMPTVMQRSMQEMQPMLGPMMEKMKGAMKDAVEEAKAKR